MSQTGGFDVPYDPPIEQVLLFENIALIGPAGVQLARGAWGLGRIAVAQGSRAVTLRLSFSAAERAIIKEASSILGSSEFAAIRAAHAAGESITVNVGGRVVQYEAGLTFAEGMSLAQVNGFVIGPRAFASSGELARTVSHELYRLQSGTLGYGQAGAYAANATRAAYDFAQRAGQYVLGGPL